MGLLTIKSCLEQGQSLTSEEAALLASKLGAPKA
jgi:hypothetical protein